jgi:hypothetical protein
MRRNAGDVGLPGLGDPGRAYLAPGSWHLVEVAMGYESGENGETVKTVWVLRFLGSLVLWFCGSLAPGAHELN